MKFTYTMVRSRVIVGWSALLKLLFFPFRRSGGARWLQAIASEGLAPTPDQAWQTMERNSRCYACGLCDGLSTKVQPSAWLAGAFRQPGDAVLWGEETQSELLRLAPEISTICPAQVDVEKIVDSVRASREALERVK